MKEILEASPEVKANGGLFYEEKFPAENLYYLLYYNFNDANDMHFGNRAISLPVDHKQVLTDCAELIKRVCELDGICEKQFFDKYDFPESVMSAVKEVKDMIFKADKTVDR